ncbi:MAG TPA: hypothetical protein VFZ09_37665 [Archangium sp.]|uniref:hypothetical protein n=1 Tax=Archangium sp. TaxID=1872627 RepID=UPI002E33F24E|nr:hypothetical protein [Archangium sp.]HEX5752008.1 hypothetical protein [Archangium sp.]
MKSRKTTGISLGAVLSGLMLLACGGVPDAELTPADGPQGTTTSALCSGVSVTTLSLAGISTYQGEMAGSGDWAVANPANAVRLEYYVDGVLRSSEDRCNASGGTSSCTGSGSWSFSASGITCGSHNFQVKAYPMVIDSAGNRTVCLDSPRSLSQSVAGDACPPLITHILYNPYFSGTYQYVDSANVTRYIFVNKNQTYYICARDGSVNGGPFTKGGGCNY